MISGDATTTRSTRRFLGAFAARPAGAKGSKGSSCTVPAPRSGGAFGERARHKTKARRGRGSRNWKPAPTDAAAAAPHTRLRLLGTRLHKAPGLSPTPPALVAVRCRPDAGLRELGPARPAPLAADRAGVSSHAQVNTRCHITLGQAWTARGVCGWVCGGLDGITCFISTCLSWHRSTLIFSTRSRNDASSSDVFASPVLRRRTHALSQFQTSLRVQLVEEFVAPP